MTTQSGVFQSEVVVHCLAEFLLAAEITLCCLNRRVSKQKLNLLKFSACEMASTRIGSDNRAVSRLQAETRPCRERQSRIGRQLRGGNDPEADLWSASLRFFPGAGNSFLGITSEQSVTLAIATASGISHLLAEE